MKVLIAAPDRDFLMSYQKLLEAEGWEVTTSFDGFQFMACLQEKKFDFVILDRSLPRVEHERLMKLINEMKTPAIILQGKRMNAGLLLKESLADSYLTYPFEPDELRERMNEILQKRESREVKWIGDARVDLGTFLLEEQTRITNEEINVLLHLQEAGEGNNERSVLPIKHGMYYVNALNQKLEGLQKKTRIQYTMSEGYRLMQL